jgi:hypothetical protein
MENGAYITDIEILTTTVALLENNEDAVDSAISERLNKLDALEEECQKEERHSCELLEIAKERENKALLAWRKAKIDLNADFGLYGGKASKTFCTEAKEHYELCVANRKRMEKRYAMAQVCLSRVRRLAADTEQALRQEKRKYREILQDGRKRLKKNKRVMDSYLQQ